MTTPVPNDSLPTSAVAGYDAPYATSSPTVVATPPPFPARPQVDHSFAWALAFAPLIFVAIDAAAVAIGSAPVGTTAALAITLLVNTFLAVMDRDRLAKAGVPASMFWALLAVPIYLVHRTRVAKSAAAIPIIWCVALVVSIAGYNYAVGVPMDTGQVEREIAQDMSRQVDMRVKVECPSTATPKVGGDFICIARAGGYSTTVTVTVQDSEGSYIWRTG